MLRTGEKKLPDTAGSGLYVMIMMQGSKAHFAELAPANVGLGPAKHEQVATNVADCECLRAREHVSVERPAS